MATNFPASLDSFTTHSSGQVITSADVNKIQDSLAAVEAKVGATASAVAGSLDNQIARVTPSMSQGFAGWSFDPWASIATNTGNVGTVYAHGMWLPTGTITNTHCYVITGAVTTHFALALYTSAGVLLSQTADKVGDGNVTGLKTYALGTPQAITAGFYYVAMAFTGASPTFFTGAGTNSAILNAAGATPPIGFRVATSATAYATTMPSPLGTLSAVGKPFWVACS
jgi:hypothetical protein